MNQRFPLESRTVLREGATKTLQVPGESNESLAQGRWPGAAADACLAWAEGEPGRRKLILVDLI